MSMRLAPCRPGIDLRAARKLQQMCKEVTRTLGCASAPRN